MASSSANLCIVHGTIASEIKMQEGLTEGKQSCSFWLSYSSHDNKTSFNTPVRLFGTIANAVHKLPVGSKIVVEGKLRTSEGNKYLKIIEGWNASW